MSLLLEICTILLKIKEKLLGRQVSGKPEQNFHLKSSESYFPHLMVSSPGNSES